MTTFNLDEIKTDPTSPKVADILDRNMPKREPKAPKLSAYQVEMLDAVDRSLRRMTAIAERLNNPRPHDDPQQLRLAMLFEAEEVLDARKQFILARCAEEIRDIRDEQAAIHALRSLMAA